MIGHFRTHPLWQNTEFLMLLPMFSKLPVTRSLPKDKMKAMAENSNAAIMMKYVTEMEENIVEKGENAGDQHFLLFRVFFQALTSTVKYHNLRSYCKG